MSYQVLARKWRPRTFSDLVGQQHVVQALVNGLDQDRVHHAFLLTGTRGVGKTTIARILAKCLNCEAGVSSKPCGKCSSCTDVDDGRFVDMLEIDAASKTKVDDTRELLETVQYTPSRGRFKVYIIDEVHMLSGHSFNALLKTLEEPPPHVKFVLATTDPQKLPITILSRCLRFSLTRLLPDQIRDRLAMILKAESVEAEDSAIMRIARAADGSMRDGLSLLDQAIAFGGGSLTDDDVASMLGSIDHAHIANIMAALVAGDGNTILDVVNELSLQSRRLESVLDELAQAMHRIVLIHSAPDFRDPERPDWDALVESAGQITPEDAQLYYQIAINGSRDLGIAPDPRTGLEMTLMRMLAFRPVEADSGATEGSAPGGSKKTATSAGSVRTEPIAPDKVAGPDKTARNTAREAFDALTREDDRPDPAKTEVTGSQALPMLDIPPEETLEQDWARLQASLKLSGAARELARNLQFESANKNRWKFLVPDTLEHLGSNSVVQNIQSALSDHLGRPVMLDLHTATESVQSVAAVTEQAELTRKSEAEQSIESDPTVKEIKKNFDAKIVPDSVQPLQ
jgi:DNA polymerase-3 subunit gamma/tau